MSNITPDDKVDVVEQLQPQQPTTTVDQTPRTERSNSCSSSDSSDPESEEFYDALADECNQQNVQQPSSSSKIESSSPTPSNSKQLILPSQQHMIDSGIYSMQSSHVEQLEPNETELTKSSIETKLNEMDASNLTVTEQQSSMPRPPPRTRKKKPTFLKQNSQTGECQQQDGHGNGSSSADSRSMTNSVESTTASSGKNSQLINVQNLASILDDIVSIKGDLSINEVSDDKRSVYLDEHLHNRQINLKHITSGMISNHKQPELIFSNEQLKTISKDILAATIESSKSGNETEAKTVTNTTPEVFNQIMIMNIDTGEKVPLSKAENILPKCLNPLSLHLMKLTNDYDENENSQQNDQHNQLNKKSSTLEKESSSAASTAVNLADTAIKNVTSLITSTLNDIKSEIKDKTSEKKAKKKMQKELSLDTTITNPIPSNVESTTELSTKYEEEEEEEDDDDDNDDDKLHNGENKDSKHRFRTQLKKFGTGIIRGVKGQRNKEHRSTFHVDLRSYSGEPDPPPPPPRFKLKVNHKRGSADFDCLKVVQEINDCKGAIWCMKYSNCSQLLAAAGQDHMLRVYCAQKSWKYFTQLRNKASGQHISPNSTKERNSANGDSFGRIQRSSFSRSGSLNANDSHNNSSSSSSSSAFAKEMYKDEDNTLSEEGPLLLFTIYRGHTADVLDLAWSKNHFLLSASMDKTVRLWHITRIECLCTFRHIDFVTTIQFHPRDDRYFISGSLDGKLRLWNIPDKRVTLWNEVNAMPVQRGGGGNGANATDGDHCPTHGLITASSFVQNGKFAVIGTYDGRIIFYTTDQLKYFTQIHVSAKSTLTNGNPQNGGASRRKVRINKVTGIESIDDNNKILVTTNDSRLRLYDLRDLSLTCKYKGCINQSSQIKAAVSNDHKFIICGSENNSFYIWRTQDNSTIGQRRDRNKQYECIRLLNPPAPSTNFEQQTVATSTSGLATSQVTNTSIVGDQLADTNLTKGPSNVGGKESSTSGPSIGPSSSTTNQLNSNQQQAQSYSSAAMKIVTSAIFAPVPGQIDDKAKYVISIADFNGCIRIFSKH